jgi:L-ascorbate metabolism protein UlaG (beta-lactamase superfamily)
MIITYQGVEFFKVQFGDITIALNPISKESKFKSSKFGSDIAIISMDDGDFNGADVVAFAEKAPFVISGPGEYEIKGITIKGFSSKTKYGGKERINTVYSINLENMNLCFLGALGEVELPKEIIEGIGNVDILFVPIGGDGVLDAAKADKISVEIEPKIIIPMHYGEVGEKDALKKFLKESGEEGVKAIDKLTIKKKELEGKEGEVVVLSTNV